MFGSGVEMRVCVTGVQQRPDIPPPAGVSSVTQNERLYSNAGLRPDSKCNLKSMADGIIDGALCKLIELKREAN